MPTLSYYIRMSKATRALLQLPPATAGALEKLGADLAVARLRRKESLRSWAQRMGVTVSTLQRLESGDPSVSIGIVATALWLIKRDGEQSTALTWLYRVLGSDGLSPAEQRFLGQLESRLFP